MDEDGPMPAMTLGQLRELMRAAPPPPRDVFVYDGTFDQFCAEVEAEGAKVTILGGVPLSMLPMCGAPPGRLAYFVVDGKVWVAAHYRDVEDAMAGKLPFKRIGGK